MVLGFKDNVINNNKLLWPVYCICVYYSKYDE